MRVVKLIGSQIDALVTLVNSLYSDEQTTSSATNTMAGGQLSKIAVGRTPIKQQI